MIDWNYNPMYVDDPTHFEDVADNYVGLPNGQDTEPLGVDSPFSLVTSALSSTPPVMLYATYGDPVFYQQAQDMHDALFTRFGMTLDLRLHIMTYTGEYNVHAFTYWHEPDTDPPYDCVSHEVIAFLQSYP
jgi:hypothetical protein